MDHPDDDPDAKWLTFKELAELRGISKDSAVALIRRRGWRRQRDNEGHVKALVPNYALMDEPAKQADNQGDVARLVAAFQASLDSLKAAHAEQVAGLKAQGEAVLAEVRAIQAKEIAELQSQLAAVQAALDATREAEAARNDLPRWQRLRRAWSRPASRTQH